VPTKRAIKAELNSLQNWVRFGPLENWTPGFSFSR